jgi:hypothetical protein
MCTDFRKELCLFPVTIQNYLIVYNFIDFLSRSPDPLLSDSKISL